MSIVEYAVLIEVTLILLFVTKRNKRKEREVKLVSDKWGKRIKEISEEIDKNQEFEGAFSKDLLEILVKIKESLNNQKSR